MVYNRRQKAGGLFNWFTKRRAKVAPIQPSRTMNIKNEGYLDALKRDYVFFYYKLRGEEPPRSLRFLTPNQEAEVRRILLDADSQGLSQDEIIQQIFHSNPQTFQEELVAWEEYLPEKYLNKGTPMERLAFPVAKSLARFIATIKRPQKNLQYVSNFMVHQCELGSRDHFVKSLTDDYCFTLLNPQNREDFDVGKGEQYPLSYIVVKSEYFPQATVSGGPITLSAKRLPTLSFLLDAFREKGVLEIEPTLEATLKREAPELLEFGERDPVVLLTPYYLTDPSTTRQRFLLVDSSFFKRGRNTVNWKVFAKIPFIQDAFVSRKVYGMDPKTMFQIRTQMLQLWLANFGAVNQRVFTKLSLHEKLAFCFLQYTKFFETYSLFRDASPLNNTSTVARKTTEAAKKAKMIVFETDYDRGANPYDLAESFQSVDTENFRQLIQLQKDVLGTVQIQTPGQIRSLLAKFDRRPETQPSPVIPNYFGPSTMNLGPNVTALTRKNRRQRVKQMTMPQNLQRERQSLMNAIKTAMKSPVKTSYLPNFLRTRRAKEANRQRYIDRIETAKRALLEFNEAHGLSRKTNDYGYKF